MEFNENLRIFFESGEVQNYIKIIQNIPISDYPRLNYFGVNFCADEISSIKLYSTFFDKKSIEIAKILLPIHKDFNTYINNFRETKMPDIQNTGCAFSIKMGAQHDITKGFHFRFPLHNNNHLYEPPIHIKLTDQDLNNYQGISFEYNAINNAKKKNYYYISDEKTKIEIAEKFQVKGIEKATIIEYTEFWQESKIIVWGKEVDANGNEITIPFSKNHNLFNKWMLEQFNLSNMFSGKYLLKNETSSYFFYQTSKSTKPFDFSNNRSINTIEYLISSNKF